MCDRYAELLRANRSAGNRRAPPAMKAGLLGDSDYPVNDENRARGPCVAAGEKRDTECRRAGIR